MRAEPTYRDQDTSGDKGAPHHLIGNLVAVRAKEGHVQGFLITPVVALQPLSSPTPRTDLRPGDQSQLFRQRSRIPRGSRPVASRLVWMKADVEMTAEPFELGAMPIRASFHRRNLSKEPRGLPERQLRFPSLRRRSVRRTSCDRRSYRVVTSILRRVSGQDHLFWKNRQFGELGDRGLLTSSPRLRRNRLSNVGGHSFHEGTYTFLSHHVKVGAER